jgi:DNA-binding transcriptional regulator YdaS (Cro superfamily)
MNQKIHPVDKAAKALGLSLEGLGALLGVTKGAVSQWKSPGRAVPVEHCLTIEKLTHGAVTRRDLRPKDFHKFWPDLKQHAA